MEDHNTQTDNSKQTNLKTKIESLGSNNLQTKKGDNTNENEVHLKKLKKKKFNKKLKLFKKAK